MKSIKLLIKVCLVVSAVFFLSSLYDRTVANVSKVETAVGNIAQAGQ